VSNKYYNISTSTTAQTVWLCSNIWCKTAIYVLNNSLHNI